MRRNHLGFAAAALGIMLAVLEGAPGIDRFVEHARQSGVLAAERGQGDTQRVVQAWAGGVLGLGAGEREQEWRRLIEEEAVKRRVAPVDARLDPVWKAVPGYNGLEVDVEASLRQAERTGYQLPPQLVYREVPPKISLDSLGAQPIYRGNPKKAMMGLMINVAWGNEFLPGMLETLRQEGVKATFFFDGMWLRENGETARRIAEAGHEIGNHAYSHKDMSKLERSRAVAEITRTHKLIEGLGLSYRLFAPPSGDFNQQTVEIAHEMGLRTILWTLDTIDWKKPAPASVVQKIGSKAEPGALVLMHPTESSSKALQGMIRAIKAKGLRLGTVSEVISPDRVPES